MKSAVEKFHRRQQRLQRWYVDGSCTVGKRAVRRVEDVAGVFFVGPEGWFRWGQRSAP